MTKARNFGPLRVRPHVVSGKATGKWFVDIPRTLTSNGKRKRKLYPNRTQAERIASELHRKLKFRQLGYVENKAQSSITFSQGADDWEAKQKARLATKKIRPATYSTRVHELKPLREFFGKYRLDGITPDLIERYQQRRLQGGRSARTANSEVATLKQVLRWLVSRGALAVLPSVESIPLGRPQRDIPTREEVVNLIGHLPPRLRPLVRLLAETGMRPGEAFNLPWCHVNEIDGYVDIAPFGDWDPKTEGSERRVWLSQGLLTEIRRLPKIGTYVFAGRMPDKPITSIKKALATAVKAAGLERDGRPLKVTPKTFRKAFATWQAESSVHPSILQKQMGHVAGSRMTEQYYVHVRDEAVRAAYTELPFGPTERREDAQAV